MLILRTPLPSPDGVADAMREIRPRILQSGWPIESRRQLFRLLAGAPALDHLQKHGIESLWNWLEKQQTFHNLPE